MKNRNEKTKEHIRELLAKLGPDELGSFLGSESAKLKHKKNPVDPEFMKRISRLGVEARKNKQKKYDVQNQDVDSDKTTQV